MRSICLVGLLALPLAGCAFQTPSSSYEALNPCYARQMEDLAAATAVRVSAQDPQKLIYVDAAHNEGTFGQSLRHELAKNQALAIKPELADVSVRYALEELTPTTGYINLRFSDGQASSQTFHLIPENTYELASQNSQNGECPRPFILLCLRIFMTPRFRKRHYRRLRQRHSWILQARHLMNWVCKAWR